MITIEPSPILTPQIVTKGQGETINVRFDFSGKLSTGEVLSAALGLVTAVPTGDLTFATILPVLSQMSFDVSGGRPERTATTLQSVATTSVAHGFLVGDRVKFRPNGVCVFPPGVLEETLYFIESIPTANTFTVACHAGGPAITIGAGVFIAYIEYLIQAKCITSEAQTLTLEGRLQIRT